MLAHRVLALRSSARRASSLVAKFEEAVSSLPMREAVRYTGKNIKWTAGEVKQFADSHANALLEHGFAKGDALALWLPDSAEKHITLLAAAKIGIKVVDIDTSLSTVPELRQVLAAASCKALFFEPTTSTQDNLLLLRKAIPEFFYYDDKFGQEFHSKHFPTIKYFVHTGFDIETGCLNYKSLFLPDPSQSAVDAAQGATSDDLPLYSRAVKGAKGWEAGAVMSQKLALEQAAFEFARKLIGKQYFEAV